LLIILVWLSLECVIFSFMSFIRTNIKYLRKQKGLTQEQLAARVGIKRSLIGAYEEGRAEPNITNLIRFSEVFEVGMDVFLNRNLTEQGADSIQKANPVANLRVLSITLDNSGSEIMHMVPAKASAGYLNGFSDPEYIAELPVFTIPFFRGGTFRAFELSGDSMLPLRSGSIVIGRYLEDWSSIKDNSLCVVITSSEGLVFKRVFNQVKKDGRFKLVSDNPVFAPYYVRMEDIVEIWEAKGYFSMTFPESDLS